MNKAAVVSALQTWQARRNTCADAEILTVDAQGALAARLPVLALLLTIMEECQGRDNISGGEMIAQLSPLSQLIAGDTR